MCARIAPHLRDPVSRCQHVDPTAALDQLLLDRCSVGRDEDFLLPLGANARRGHLHVLLLEAALGAEAELDLVGERDGEGVALDRGAELPLGRLSRRERTLVAARRGLGEGASLFGGGACALGA